MSARTCIYTNVGIRESHTNAFVGITDRKSKKECGTRTCKLYLLAETETKRNGMNQNNVATIEQHTNLQLVDADAAPLGTSNAINAFT